jgi:energy-coupling factor transporter ATP-binding protein EcfA2
MKQLESFTVEQFRGLRNLDMQGLGRINLLVGANNAGKSSVLEALSCYCRPLDGFHWLETGLKRFDRTRGVSRIEAVKWLFRQSSSPSPIQSYERGRAMMRSSGGYCIEECRAEFEEFEAIRRREKGSAAQEVVETLAGDVSGQDPGLGRRGAELRLHVKAGSNDPLAYVPSRSTRLDRQLTIWDDRTIIKRRPRDEMLLSLPVELLNARQIQADSASAEKFSEFRKLGLYAEAVDILRHLDEGVRDVLVLAESGGIGRLYMDHARTGMTPLSACGDGVRRSLQIAMTIPRVRNGILLVDEIESALHVSALASVFRLLAIACKEHNVQLFATTHSLEAVDTILEASLVDSRIDLVSYRLASAPQGTTVRRLDEPTLATVRNELGHEVR